MTFLSCLGALIVFNSDDDSDDEDDDDSDDETYIHVRKVYPQPRTMSNDSVPQLRQHRKRRGRLCP